MACLALYPDQLVPTSTLAEQTKVPSNYLAKVLQQLASAGLVSGRRGVGGGYRLSRPSNEISLVEVVRAVDRLERIERCPLGISSHGTTLCALHRIIDLAAARLIELLDGVSLKDLLNDSKSKSKPLCDNAATAQLSISGSLKVPESGKQKS